MVDRNKDGPLPSSVRAFCTGGWGESLLRSQKFEHHFPPPKVNSLSPHPPSPTSHHPPPLNNSFRVITHPPPPTPPRNFIFSRYHCSCTIFILTSYSLYTQVMLIFILIDDQSPQQTFQLPPSPHPPLFTP